MSEIFKNKNSVKDRNRRVHMANERTFLAWIRTSIGIMALGFVVKKFGLENTLPPSDGYSSIFGIGLVGLGTLMALFAFLRYKKVQKQIDEDSYKPSSRLAILLTASVFVVGIVLVMYLMHNS